MFDGAVRDTATAQSGIRGADWGVAVQSGCKFRTFCPMLQTVVYVFSPLCHFFLDMSDNKFIKNRLLMGKRRT